MYQISIISGNWFWSFINDFDVEAFKNGTVSDVMISVEYTGQSDSMKTSDNSKMKAYIAKEIDNIMISSH